MLWPFEIDDTSSFTCWFLTNFFIKQVSLKRFCKYMKLLQSSIIFKQGNNHEVSWDKNFSTKLFTALNSKKLIATLPIVTTEKPELTFRLLL